jgi:hypothetical protein
MASQALLRAPVWEPSPSSASIRLLVGGDQSPSDVQKILCKKRRLMVGIEISQHFCYLRQGGVEYRSQLWILVVRVIGVHVEWHTDFANLNELHELDSIMETGKTYLFRRKVRRIYIYAKLACSAKHSGHQRRQL